MRDSLYFSILQRFRKTNTKFENVYTKYDEYITIDFKKECGNRTSLDYVDNRLSFF